MSSFIRAVVGACLLSQSAFGQTHPVSDRQAVNPPGISPLVPAYSVVVRAGDVIFVSGMTGIKPGTQDIIDGGVAAQTRQTMENIRTALQAVGSTMDRVSECTVFLIDMGDYAPVSGARPVQGKSDDRADVLDIIGRPTARVPIVANTIP
jgi:enamine deaminase RidA (YjgF/YER057c/UK114 family)